MTSLSGRPEGFLQILRRAITGYAKGRLIDIFARYNSRVSWRRKKAHI